MKITAMVGSESNDTRRAFSTDPPVTKKLLEIVKQLSGSQLDRFLMSESQGLLLLKPPILPNHIQLFAEFLTQAENHRLSEKQESKRGHEDSLRAWAEQAGLPLKENNPMKITEIIDAETDGETITFRVEPPLTDEVFEAFQNRLKNTKFPKRSIKDGKLTVAFDMELSAKSIKTFNEVLESAEKEIKDAKESDERDRQKYLEALAYKLGLPVK